jgi:hypothetical protein
LAITNSNNIPSGKNQLLVPSNINIPIGEPTVTKQLTENTIAVAETPEAPIFLFEKKKKKIDRFEGDDWSEKKKEE